MCRKLGVETKRAKIKKHNDAQTNTANKEPNKRAEFENLVGQIKQIDAVTPGALRSDGKTLFLVYTYVWQEDVAKIFKVPGAPRNVNPVRAITW